jgi:hypothetical protein
VGRHTSTTESLFDGDGDDDDARDDDDEMSIDDEKYHRRDATRGGDARGSTTG